MDSNDKTDDEHGVDDDDTCYNEMAWNVVKEIIIVCYWFLSDRNMHLVIHFFT